MPSLARVAEAVRKERPSEPSDSAQRSGESGRSFPQKKRRRREEDALAEAQEDVAACSASSFAGDGVLCIPSQAYETAAALLLRLWLQPLLCFQVRGSALLARPRIPRNAFRLEGPKRGKGLARREMFWFSVAADGVGERGNARLARGRTAVDDSRCRRRREALSLQAKCRGEIERLADMCWMCACVHAVCVNILSCRRFRLSGGNSWLQQLTHSSPTARAQREGRREKEGIREKLVRSSSRFRA